MVDNVTNVLGFSFLIFQRGLGTFIKCWFNGSQDWSFFSKEELIGFASKIECSYEFKIKLLDCLSTYSIFLWDVENESIRRLSANFEPGKLRITSDDLEKFVNSNSDDKYNGNVHKDNDVIHLKID